jgi:ATP-dependent helicase HrpA
VARAVHVALQEFSTASRKLKDARPTKDVQDDIAAQLQRLVPKRFVLETPWQQLQYLPRYLKAITARLDKQRADAPRDAKLMQEAKALEQRYTRRVAELKGVRDARLEDFRWQLEELRVSLFAQELRTPQPVSVKRLEKVWQQIGQA